MKEITYRPIGVVHSPFRDVAGVPIQPRGAVGVRGTVEVYQEFAAGLKDLEGFSRVCLLYHFHLSRGWQPHVVPFLDTEPRGLFATRAPRRPNPIGLSVVKLLGVEANVLEIEEVDVVDGTPLLDIKPFVPEFDLYEVERVGWLEQARRRVEKTRSDDRFGC
jgi:tRNA-Thr(GGU) m(6)t(6)A37 methyltransferase TsaA